MNDWLEVLRPLLEWAQANVTDASHIAFAIPVGVLLLQQLLFRRPEEIPADHTPERIAPGAEAAPAPAVRPELEEPRTEELPGDETAPTVEVPAFEELAPTREVPALEEPAPTLEMPAPDLAAAAPEPVPAPEPARRVPLRERLARTSEAFVGRLGRVLSGRTVDADLLEELEALLFTADLGVPTAEALLERVRNEAAAGSDADRVRQVLRDAIAEKLRSVDPDEEPLALAASPHVILVLGVNGAGKTTTIGKLAARHAALGRSVVLGAGDTFRAAAREQLESWGERVGCDVVSGPEGSDSAAVAFETVQAAKARGADVAIIDTAGRLQTKAPLMEELSKVARVIGKACEGAPHETLLVLDANTGQNAISQAREFTGAAPVTGLVLTKLDGTAKGGVIVGLADEFGIPVRHVGVGEGVDDLRDFSAEEFVDALFAG